MSLLKGINSLKQAYLDKNWDLVRESYELISGESLEAIEEVENEPSKIIKPRNKKVSKPSKTVKTIDKKLPVVKRTTGGQVKFQGNIFDSIVDLMDTSSEIDKKIDAKLGKGFKRRKPRAKKELTEATCRSCKKEFKVDPEYLISSDSFICESCIIGKGKNAG